MSIIVTCPRCGRSIKARKKFVLAQGGVPCLKCRVRISINREQLEAYADTEGDDDSAETSRTAVPATVPDSHAAAPEPAREPEPVAVPEPAPDTPAFSSPTEMALHQAFNGNGDSDAVVAALYEPEKETLPAGNPSPSGSQLLFTCPGCAAQSPLRRALGGKKIRCPACSRIVRVDPDSPVIPDSAAVSSVPSPSPTNSPLSTLDREPTRPIVPPVPPPVPKAVEAPAAVPGNGAASLEELRRELAEARDNASAAEEILQQFSRDKIKSEMALLRRTREAEALSRSLEVQVRDLSARVDASAHALDAVRAEKETESAGWLEKTKALEGRIAEQDAGAAAKAAELDDLKAKISALETESIKREADSEALLTDMQKLENKVLELERQKKDLESQVAELQAEIAVKITRIEGLERTEGLLRTLSISLERTIRQEIDSHQVFLDNLRGQLKQCG